MEISKIGNLILSFSLCGLMFFLPAAVSAQEESATRDEVEQQIEDPAITMREDFSDDELKSFVKANEKVMAIQMETEQKMIAAIEDEGLTVDRFNEILEQQRDPSRGGNETSANELNSFNNAAQVILQENEKIEKAMATKIEEEGIDVVTYKQIMTAYQQRPEIQGRVNELLSSEN
jgi:hypothetical protein